MTTATRYHVFTEDGFESAHRSLAAAEKAAKRGHKNRGMAYAVIECDPYHGLTGGGYVRVIRQYGKEPQH